jgi:hypothetical protein
MYRLIIKFLRKPRIVKNLAAALRDSFGLPAHDPGIDRAIDLGYQWLCLAQDNSASKDGGVAANYNLVAGWAPSYPETTGYIVPTMLDYAKLRNDNSARTRAARMLDWFVSIQFSEGSFQGGSITATPVVPVTFNTGQILLGLAAGVREFGGKYAESMRKAANWLVDTQDPDGCWRKYLSPFAGSGVKAFDTHVAWGLFEAARIEPDKPYAETALKNIRWALTQQHKNGWFENCTLENSPYPVTHTLGYVLRGILEAYKFSNNVEFLEKSILTADGLLSRFREDGFLAGGFNSDWSDAVTWVCLTGTVQVAHCWLILYEITGEVKYRDAGFLANKYVRRTMRTGKPPETRGAIKGSFPTNGKYLTYLYPNWATKFCMDSNMLEKSIREREGTQG